MLPFHGRFRGARGPARSRPRTRRGPARRAHPGVAAHAVRGRGSRTHPRAALLHGGQHSQGAGRTRAEVEEVQRRARRLLQEPARGLRVLTPPGVLRAPRPRGRRRRPLEGEQQQQQRDQRGGGARVPGRRRGQGAPVGLHGRGRAGAALGGLGLGARDAGARGNKAAAGPSPPPPGQQAAGSPAPRCAAPLGATRARGPSAPPRSAWPSLPGRGARARRRRGAQGRGVRPRPRGHEGGSGGSYPEGSAAHPAPPGATRRPLPVVGPSSSPLRLLGFRNSGFQSEPTSVLQNLEQCFPRR